MSTESFANPFLSPRSVLRGRQQPPGQSESTGGPSAPLRTPPEPSPLCCPLLFPPLEASLPLGGPVPGHPPPRSRSGQSPAGSPRLGAGCGVLGAGCGVRGLLWGPEPFCSREAAGASCPAGEKFARRPAHSKGAQAGSGGSVCRDGLQLCDPLLQPRKRDLALHSSSGAHLGVAGAPGPVLSL